ncbi:MAG: hypothetical protein ACK47C_17035 [Paracoccaceae bacterium]
MTDLPEDVHQSPRYKALHAAREENALRARQCQTVFSRLNTLFIVATACAAVLGGLLLYGIDPAPAATEPAGTELSGQLKDFLGIRLVRITVSILQALSLGLAAFAAYLLTQRDYAACWLDYRLKAEKGRLDLAKQALEIAHSKGTDPFRVTGTWFNDTFVAKQLEHLKDRGTKHDRRAFYLAVFGAVISAVGIMSATIGTTGVPVIVLIAAFIGVLSPAFISALKSWGEASGDQGRAKLHQGTWEALNALAGDRETFDAAIMANDLPGALAYAEQVFAVLRTDHEGFAALLAKVSKPGNS